MIAQVAMRRKSTGQVWALPPPNRHHNLFTFCDEKITSDFEQGFLDSQGTFLDRLQAFTEALSCGQIGVVRPKTQPADTLFSEDLW